MTTPSTKLRRDAAASVFAYALAGGALVVHVAATLTDDWGEGRVALRVTGAGDLGASTLRVDSAQVPAWALTTLRAAELGQWLAGAAVLVMLTVCVVRMIRGEIFTRSTARWATGASWAALLLLLLPPLLRGLATNVALHATVGTERWEPHAVTPEWWYLYVGMMTLSFLALVLRRGSQLQEDQDGLI
ncbi:hypothetical protein [Janibacter alittae]|uniref:DUF2975 domain-containing protein n=1 Tax=Janibacter alittae TaxID=3115209 RepID=A0ABZ2MKV7_9MICO